LMHDEPFIAVMRECILLRTGNAKLAVEKIAERVNEGDPPPYHIGRNYKSHIFVRELLDRGIAHNSLYVDVDRKEREYAVAVLRWEMMMCKLGVPTAYDFTGAQLHITKANLDKMTLAIQAIRLAYRVEPPCLYPLQQLTGMFDRLTEGRNVKSDVDRARLPPHALQLWVELFGDLFQITQDGERQLVLRPRLSFLDQITRR